MKILIQVKIKICLQQFAFQIQIECKAKKAIKDLFCNICSLERNERKIVSPKVCEM